MARGQGARRAVRAGRAASPRRASCRCPTSPPGGIATPADAALCMALGAEAVFVGSGIFKSEDPAARARAIVRATTHWQDASEVLAASRGLGEADARPRDGGDSGGRAARTREAGERRRARPSGRLRRPRRVPSPASGRDRGWCAARPTSPPSTRSCCPAASPRRCCTGIAREQLDQPLRVFLSVGAAGARHVRRRDPARRDRVQSAAGGVRRARCRRRAQRYGTQLDSFDTVAETDDPVSPFAGMRCVLIRAPRIVRTGSRVQVHARIGGTPALVSNGPVWAATFHPELTADCRVLRAVLDRRIARADP